MEGGNRARTEDRVHGQWLRKEKLQRDEDGDAGRGDAGDLLEADAFVAELRMSELLFRRHFLAKVRNRMRVRRLLREKQQNDQQGIEAAIKFHGQGSPAGSVAP